MSAREFEPGEVVDITIEGARVKRHGGSGFLVLIVDGRELVLMVDLECVTVERVAPPEWPPQPGDLWHEDRPEDRGGPETWFAQRYLPDFDDKQDAEGINAEGWRVVMVPLNGGPYGESEKRPEQLLGEQLTLVHREDPARRVRDFETRPTTPDEGGAQ